MKNRLNNIQIMRIIACFGVFFGHFLGTTFPSVQLGLLLDQLRSGFLSFTPVAWFVMGDLDVLFFYAAGGFFLSYTFKDSSDMKAAAIKLAEKLCSLFIPALLVTFVFAGLKFLSVGDAHVIQTELFADIVRIIRGTYNGSYEPTLSYQLWYIHFMARGCVFGLCYNYLFRKNKYLREIFLCILIPLLWWRNMTGIWQIATGMLAGNIVKDIDNKTLPVKHEVVLAFGIAALAFVPLMCQSGGIQHNLTAMLMIGVFLICDTLAERAAAFCQPGIIMRFLEKNNYSFYLLHVLILTFAARPVYNYMTAVFQWNENIVLLICFIIAVIITLALSEVFSSYVLPLFKFSRRTEKTQLNK